MFNSERMNELKGKFEQNKDPKWSPAVSKLL